MTTTSLVPVTDWELDTLLFDAYLAAMRPGSWRPDHVPSVSQIGGMGHFIGGIYTSWDDAAQYIYDTGMPVDYVEILKVPGREEYVVWVNDTGSIRDE